MEETQLGGSELIFRGGIHKLWASTADHVLVVGPAGSGKTLGIAARIKWLCELELGVETWDGLNWWRKDRPLRILFVRQTMLSLRESVQVTWEDQVLGQGHAAIHGTAARANRRNYKFPDGDEVVLGGLDKPERLFSTEWDIIWVEEAIETNWAAVGKFPRSLRNHALRRNGAIFSQLILSTNPGPESHYLNVMSMEGKIEMILSRHWDNPAYYAEITPGVWDWTDAGRAYFKQLDHLTGLDRTRLLEGKWVSCEGLVYPEYDRARHVIDGTLKYEPQTDTWWFHEDGMERRRGAPENTWKLPEKIKWFVGGVDWGSDDPGCMQVWAVLEGDKMLLVREIYMRHKTLDWWAGRASDFVDEFGSHHLHVFICDHSPDRIQGLNDRLGTPGGREQARIARSALKGPDSVPSGIQHVQEGLQVGEGVPKIRFLSDLACYGTDRGLKADYLPTGTLQEFGQYIWLTDSDGHHKDKPDPKCADHGMDCMRYVMRWVWRRDLTPTPVAPSKRKGTMAWLRNEQRHGRGKVL